MITGVFPGSFDPWHAGHQDVLDKALTVFERVQIAVAMNPDKDGHSDIFARIYKIERAMGKNKYKRVNVVPVPPGFLLDHIKNYPDIKAIVRGLRDGKDLENERVQQYTNEDLAKEFGLYLPPTVFFVTDRNLVHVSSSAIHAINLLKEGRRL